MIPAALLRARGQAADWYALRSPREQALLAAFGCLAVIALFVTLVWSPLRASQAAARADIRTYAAVTARLKAAGPVLAPAPAPAAGPPATLVTDAAAEAGLTIQRLQPEGAVTRVSLEDAEFNRVIRWLDRLETQGRLRIAEIKLERRPAPGAVNAQLTLAGR